MSIHACMGNLWGVFCPNSSQYQKSLCVQYLFEVKVHTLKSKIGVLYLGLLVYLKIIKT